ncbi:MAG: cytochrome c5 family protein [Halioglobus sp.]
MNRCLLVGVLITSLSLIGCGGDGTAAKSGSSKAGGVASRDLSPQNAEIASIYNRSCRSCHTVGGTGAPLTGDVAAWEPRMAKGMDVLVNSVVEGFGGMPPFGFCMDCDVEQFEALITFMAQGK